MAARIMPSGGSKTDKPWRDALMRAVKRRDAGDALALERLADAAVKKGLAGDVSALKEIGDRLDGRPVQQVDAQVDGSIAVRWAK